MNFGSDQRVRDAFLATLQSEASNASILGTQEVDAADVLEVTDLANAIARAEESIRARSSRVLANGPDSSAGHESRREDIFDKLVAARHVPESPEGAAAPEATDDAVGPAVHIPPGQTPLPPRTSSIPLPPGIARSATLLRAPEEVFATPIPAPTRTTTASETTTATAAAPTTTTGTATATATAPLAPPPTTTAPSSPTATAPTSVNVTQRLAALPAPRSAPILILDEDAFYHPAGRIRSLADVTLEAYRPEPTLMVRLRERRATLQWVVAGVVGFFAIFTIFAIAVGFGRAAAEGAAASEAKPAERPTTVTAPAASPTAPLEASPPARPSAEPAFEVPVFDVNSLRNVPPEPRR